ncbi:putative PPPDE putative peptidase domain-containing protein [Helianthus annuus]|uniref:PPPDE putative peptidase domain-containing protein n=1 Tax=Helianthus annuus TaxID=4232 RepID=A0A251SYG0_HELAN|nr:putative PPPDE putative peptidase domain-containing protein [Helianthus annuus]KAJ0491471.1 putative PPPDE peptidase domain, PPPDE putative peptidase domain superfamily [Helianthus annuus]KAJ0503920.1 putative PPPDE peptidase domain-containing protein [Helianthus annuus]KAJ0861248.1 putative PPPDE putative peptidase domain-containing protein [Helianthus annuus]
MTRNALGWTIIHVYHYTWSNGVFKFHSLLFFFYLCLILMIHEKKNDGWELVAVYGMEYAFGAHDYSISGVFEVEPRTCPGFIYRCSISLRHTNMSPSEFRAFIETIASEYNGDTYHLISKNCKNFTDDISQRLNCKGIPGWVNRLAKLGKEM